MPNTPSPSRSAARIRHAGATYAFAASLAAHSALAVWCSQQVFARPCAAPADSLEIALKSAPPRDASCELEPVRVPERREDALPAIASLDLFAWLDSAEPEYQWDAQLDELPEPDASAASIALERADEDVLGGAIDSSWISARGAGLALASTSPIGVGALGHASGAGAGEGFGAGDGERDGARSASSSSVAAPVATRPSCLSNPSPVYPRIARVRRWQGTTRLRVCVLASGRVGTASVVDSSGHDVLDDAALEAVLAWLFVPAHLGELAVDSTVEVPIEWKLVE